MICPKCKNNWGFISEENHHLFFNDNHQQIGFGKNYKNYGQKIRFKCNNPECKFLMNLYIKFDIWFPKHIKEKLKIKEE